MNPSCIMQLPRGRFRSIEKGERLGNLLDKLRSDQFSGVCSIICRGHSIETVIEKGRILLASCDDLLGDDAMGVIGSLLEQQYDASISDLTPAQLKLSFEFNRACIVRHPIASEKEIPQTQPKKSDNVFIDDISPLKISESKTETVIPKSHKTSPREGRVKEVQPQQSRREFLSGDETVTPKSPIGTSSGAGDEKVNPSESGYTLDDLDLKALDSMDLDVMTRKIRDNCKLLVERLHLGYLVVEEDKKESG